jgi:ABC-type amino acid transport system permease subunit
MKNIPPIKEVIDLLKDTTSQSKAAKFAKGSRKFTMPKWVKWVDRFLTFVVYLFAAVMYYFLCSGFMRLIQFWFNG